MPISKARNKRHQKNRNIINNNVPKASRHAVRFALAQYAEKVRKMRLESARKRKIMKVKR